MKYIDNIDGIKAVHVNIHEAETVINFSRNDDVCNLYTTDNKIITKMKRAMKKSSEYRCYVNSVDNDHNPTSYCFEFPKKRLSFRTTNSSKKLSEEQRNAARERFRNYWKNKNENK